MRLIATAERFDEQWDIRRRVYRYNGSNRKAAINWALKKIQKAFPDHKIHTVEIEEA